MKTFSHTNKSNVCLQVCLGHFFCLFVRHVIPHCLFSPVIFVYDCFSGEKMTEEEVEMLLAGHEDANGLINYEGESKMEILALLNK